MISARNPRGCSAPKTPADLAPVGSATRRTQLQAVLLQLSHAQFPRDYAKFGPWAARLREETDQGSKVQFDWSIWAGQPGAHIPGVTTKRPDVCPDVLFLHLLQAALRASRQTELEAKLQEPNFAEKLRQQFEQERHDAARDPVPARRLKLMERIRRREQAAWLKAVPELRERVETLENAYHDLCELALGKQPPARPRQPEPPARLLHISPGEYLAGLAGKKPPAITPEERRRLASLNQDSTPLRPEICLWTEPMTVQDYVTATGRNRRTIRDFLVSIEARPCAQGHHAAQGARYPLEINLRVLAHWLEAWTPKPAVAARVAGATVARHYDGGCDDDVLLRLCGTIEAVAARRKWPLRLFERALEQHLKLYRRVPAT